jgi:hypothetical protein
MRDSLIDSSAEGTSLQREMRNLDATDTSTPGTVLSSRLALDADQRISEASNHCVQRPSVTKSYRVHGSTLMNAG